MMLPAQSSPQLQFPIDSVSTHKYSLEETWRVQPLYQDVFGMYLAHY
jgi:hypothetical protein